MRFAYLKFQTRSTLEFVIGENWRQFNHVSLICAPKKVKRKLPNLSREKEVLECENLLSNFSRGFGFIIGKKSVMNRDVFKLEFPALITVCQNGSCTCA